MENIGDFLKKAAIVIGVFLLLVAFTQGAQEAAGIGKEIVSGIKEGTTSVVVFVREIFKAV